MSVDGRDGGTNLSVDSKFYRETCLLSAKMEELVCGQQILQGNLSVDSRFYRETCLLTAKMEELTCLLTADFTGKFVC